MKNNYQDYGAYDNLNIIRIQNERHKEYQIRTKLRKVRDQYYDRMDAMKDLGGQILKAREFKALKNDNYLADIEEKINDKKEHDEILKKIKQEDKEFLSKRNKGLFNDELMKNINKRNEENEEEEKESVKEIEAENNSCCNKIFNCFKKILNCLLPFKDDLRYLEYNFNSTIVTLFSIIRFLFLMSLMALIIFLIIIFKHISSQRDGKKKCKYGIPCAFFYSSFDFSEAKDISVTIGVFIFLFFLFSLIFYYKNQSINFQEKAFIHNNKYNPLSSYLFNSWNCNIRENYHHTMNNQKLFNDLWEYTDDYLNKDLKEKIEKEKFTYGYSECCRKFTIAMMFALYFLVLILYSWFLSFCFNIRNEIANTKDISNKYQSKDAFGDIIFYLLFSFALLFFPYLVGIIADQEKWKDKKKKMWSRFLKKIICSLWGFINLIFIFYYFTLQNHTTDNFFLGFLLSDEPTMFGCPGKISNSLSFPQNIEELAALNNNEELFNSDSGEIDYEYYARCREDEVGLNLMFISLAYLVLYLLKEFFIWVFSKCTCFNNCCCCKKDVTSKDNKVAYSPMETLLQTYTFFCLFAFTLCFMPYFVIFFPFFMLIEFKIEFNKIKKRANIEYDDVDIFKRGNSKKMLQLFLIFNVAAIVSISYFYIIKAPHTYAVKCFSDGTTTNMYYDKDYFCGPVDGFTRISSSMSNAIKNSDLFGFFYSIFKESVFIIILFIFAICTIKYRSYNPSDEYYEYTINQQKEILDTFQSLYEQIAKRDRITKLLISLNEKGDKID